MLCQGVPNPNTRTQDYRDGEYDEYQGSEGEHDNFQSRDGEYEEYQGRDVEYGDSDGEYDGEYGDEYDEYGEDYAYPEYDEYRSEPFGNVGPADNCSDFSETGYKCVPYYNCENGTIITDGGDILLGIRQDKKSTNAVLDPDNSICPTLLEVCCRSDDFFKQPVTKNEVTDTPLPPNINTGKRPVSEKPETPKTGNIEPDYPDYPDVTDLGVKQNYQCGIRNKKGVEVLLLRKFRERKRRSARGGKVRGGSINFGKHDSQFGEWPHMCALLNQIELGAREKVFTYICGASLIAPHIVLTAAHCVYNLEAANIFIKCGEWDTQQELEPKEHQTRQAKQITLHPGFIRRGVHNDLAVVHLESSFLLDEHINPVCLPTSRFDESYSKEKCVATGWGKNKFGDAGLYQKILKQVELNLVDSKECENKMKKTRLGADFKLSPSFLCAGGKEEFDTCTGDGGGPLVCPRKNDSNSYVQTGIVSWGIGCFTENPGVYADVAKATCFIDWASKCVDGSDVDHFGSSSSCTGDWAKLTYCDYIGKIGDLENELTTLTLPIEKGRTEKKIYHMRKLLRPFEQAIKNCKHHGNQSFGCAASRGR